MKKEQFQAITSHAFRDDPVEEDLALFISGTDAITNTVLMDLLLDELAKGDGRICLAISNYRALIHSFPQIAGSDRVQLVFVDSHEFIRALSLAGRIYTIWYLPVYYVKKEGQTIYQINSRKRLAEKSTGAVRSTHFTRTANNTDFYMREGFYDDLRSHTAPVEDRLAVLLPSSHHNPKKEVERLKQARKAGKKGRTIYGISSAAWDYCFQRRDLEPDLLNDVYPFTYSVREIFQKAGVIVSANESVIDLAVRSGRDCVFYGRSEDKFPDSVHSAQDIYEGMEEGYRILIENRQKNPGVGAEASCSRPLVGEDDFIPSREEEERILIETDWANRREYGYLYRFIKSIPSGSHMDIDFLFHGIERKELEDESDGLLRDVNILIREGLYQCGNEEPLEFEPGDPPFAMEDEDIRREWKRILGNVEYDHAWLSSESQLPFSAMRDQVPGKKRQTLKDQEIWRCLADLFVDAEEGPGQAPLLETAESCLLDGDEFLSLGEVEGKEVCLSRKVADKPYFLVKYNEQYDRQIREVLAGLTGEKATAIIVDPTNKLDDLPEMTSVIRIPTRFVPPALIRGCETFLTPEGEVENAVAGTFSVPRVVIR